MVTTVRGFTLVELITCIVIIGILAVAVGPRFFADSTAFSARGYADEVASALRYAQAVAVSSGCDVSLTLTAKSYQAQQRAAAAANAVLPCVAAGPWTTAVLRGDGSTLSGNAPSGITLKPTTQIIFNSQGQVTSGKPPLLSTGSFTLSIDATSGLVTVQ